MTTSEKTEAWRALFSSLNIDIESSSPPVDPTTPQDDRPWFQTLTRFTRRGFLRVLVTPSAQHIGVHTQYAVPGADSEYAQSLKGYLNTLSGANWSSETTNSPWTLSAEGISLAKAKAVIEAFLRVADHIAAAEDGARASVLADEFGSGPKKEYEAPAKSVDPVDSNTSSNPFETIGNGSSSESPSLKADTERDSSATDNPGLQAFRVAVRDGVIHADIDLKEKPTKDAESSLLAAFAQALPIRFDVVLLAGDFADAKSLKNSVPASIKLMMRSNIETETGEIAGDLGRYFERIKKFNDFGLPLVEALGGKSAVGDKKPVSRAARPAEPERISRHSFGAAVAPMSNEAATESNASGNVVLSFGGGALDVEDITSDALRPGDYTDPRIRRDDATTPLVDVVLRHPGYSDKSMRQVLSILLDVSYFDATKLIERAPCLIAWGISQERAAEFKSVIENAGGRVTLVEPDSLS